MINRQNPKVYILVEAVLRGSKASAAAVARWCLLELELEADSEQGAPTRQKEFRPSPCRRLKYRQAKREDQPLSDCG